ncbi:formate--tetrahydrofolate ligase [bacterium]|nr:formate--tetrahydrofolate ligase [bacterium]
MPTDLEIASKVTLKPIIEIAEKAGFRPEHIIPYGSKMAKISLDAANEKEAKAPMVLVTAMTPTPAGEGKTTVSIGLSEALNRRGHLAIATLREPSLGPVFGVKGGAAGGGWSQVLPMEEINLHFTGDIHAITAAHNLLAALLDNKYSRATKQCLLPKEIRWNRVLDMNDRALRNIVIGLGSEAGQVRESKFGITASSEIMAILALAKDPDDLHARLSRIVVAESATGGPITAKDINAEGAMSILLKDAIQPNLVQTIEGNPAIIHAGPFANIAHGTNSIIATNISRRYADIVVTEAGFASDLGAEKFFNLVSRQEGTVPPDAVVIVATIRALKYHGGVKKKELNNENVEALTKGFANLEKHIENMQSFNRPVIVALNQFITDTDAEIAKTMELIKAKGADAEAITIWADGGGGALDLADKVWAAVHEDRGPVSYTYELDDCCVAKIEKVCKNIYGADQVIIPRSVKKKIDKLREWGFSNLPICMAKTQSSLSDDKKLRGRPTGFTVEIKDITINAGAGFMVVYAGDIMTMPGLAAKPAAENMSIDSDGNIQGLF